MPPILSALLTVFALIVLGYSLKRTGAFPDSLWAGVELLIYWVLLPGLLVVKLGNTDLSQFDIMPMAGAMAGAMALVAISLVGIRKTVGIAGPVYTSILQGGIRQNSFIGLYGASGQALAAVGIAAVIPLVNVISMWSLARLGPGGPPSVWMILKRLGDPKASGKKPNHHRLHLRYRRQSGRYQHSRPGRSGARSTQPRRLAVGAFSGRRGVGFRRHKTRLDPIAAQ